MDKDTNKTDGVPSNEGWVDGRLLHQELKVGRNFCAWIQERIKRFGFIQGVDYLSIPEKPITGHLTKYTLSSCMAEKLIAFEQRNQIQNTIKFITFNFGERILRATIINGKTWFLFTDILKILGILRMNKFPDDILYESNKTIFSNIDNCKIPLKHQIIDEIGLYTMFFRSRKSEAAEACKWLINEAMPQIRKAFVTAEKPISVLDKIFNIIKGGRK